MIDLTVNRAEAERVVLEDTWRSLARYVVAAKEAQVELARDRSLQDAWKDALARWVVLFEREIAAVQTVYEAAARGEKLSAEDLSTARSVAETLLATITKAQALVSPPAAVEEALPIAPEQAAVQQAAQAPSAEG